MRRSSLLCLNNKSLSPTQSPQEGHGFVDVLPTEWDGFVLIIPQATKRWSVGSEEL
jgi:hypothetical protein